MRKVYIFAFYLILLMASHLTRLFQKENPVSPESLTVEVQAFDGDKTLDKRVRLAYREFTTSNSQQSNQVNNTKDSRPVVVLLHGSPGNAKDFNSLAPMLAKNFRVIRPDLPGFGDSSHNVPDYSTRAHAHYVLALLDALGVERAHVVGFSMGGGVALNMADIAPERISSLTMLSSIGVQEME